MLIQLFTLTILLSVVLTERHCPEVRCPELKCPVCPECVKPRMRAAKTFVKRIPGKNIPRVFSYPIHNEENSISHENGRPVKINVKSSHSSSKLSVIKELRQERKYIEAKLVQKVENSVEIDDKDMSTMASTILPATLKPIVITSEPKTTKKMVTTTERTTTSAEKSSTIEHSTAKSKTTRVKKVLEHKRLKKEKKHQTTVSADSTTSATTSATYPSLDIDVYSSRDSAVTTEPKISIDFEGIPNPIVLNISELQRAIDLMDSNGSEGTGKTKKKEKEMKKPEGVSLHGLDTIVADVSQPVEKPEISVPVDRAGYKTDPRFAAEEIHIEDKKCNDSELMKILVEGMHVDDSLGSKRSIGALLSSQPNKIPSGQVSVMCSHEQLAFRLVARKYCQLSAGSATCVVFML